jgi:hypothetical protein
LRKDIDSKADGGVAVLGAVFRQRAIVEKLRKGVDNWDKLRKLLARDQRTLHDFDASRFLY